MRIMLVNDELFLHKLDKFMIKHDKIGVGVFIGFADDKIGVYFENGLKLWFNEDAFDNNDLKFIKPTYEGILKQQYYSQLTKDPKHDWVFAEDLMCCCLFVKFYVLNKQHNMDKYIVAMLQSVFPNLKSSAIIYKLRNIAYICKKEGVIYSEDVYPLDNYSEQNYCAMVKVLKDLNIKQFN